MSHIFSSKSSSPQPLPEDVISHDLEIDCCDEAASRHHGSDDIAYHSHTLVSYSHTGPSYRDDVVDFVHSDHCDTASLLHQHDLSPKSCYDVETDDFSGKILRDSSDSKSGYFRKTSSSHKSDKINYNHANETLSSDHRDKTSNNNNVIKDLNHLDYSCDYVGSANGDSYHRTFMTENYNSTNSGINRQLPTNISESHAVEYDDDGYKCTADSSRNRKVELRIRQDSSAFCPIRIRF